MVYSKLGFGKGSIIINIVPRMEVQKPNFGIIEVEENMAVDVE
jgi:hypothetical protein